MRLHDRIFALGGVALCAAVVPAVFNQITTPIWTAALMAGVLGIYTINYLSMKYRWAAVTTGIQTVLWTLVLIEGIH